MGERCLCHTMNVDRRRYLALAGGAVTTAAAGCSGGSSDTTTTSGGQTSTTGGSGGSAKIVGMYTEGGNYYFDPIGLYVEPGTTVTFENRSGAHTSTSYSSDNDAKQRIPKDAQGWDSGILTSVGATFDVTFDVKGTYDYYCTPHKTLDMIGRIVVGEAGGPAEGSMPPDGKVPTSDKIISEKSISYDSFQG